MAGRLSRPSTPLVAARKTWMAATERGHDGVNVNGETLSVFEGHGPALAKRMPTCYVIAMKMSAKDILARVENWPVEGQDELVEVAREIEARRTGDVLPG